MTPELTALAWACLLALVHIFAPALVRTRQYGLAWNAGARDEPVPPPNALAGRLARAQANFFETFPLFAAAVLIVSVAGLNGSWTALGAWLWLGARAVYLPVYAAGIPYLRGLVFAASVAGLLIVLAPALFG